MQRRLRPGTCAGSAARRGARASGCQRGARARCAWSNSRSPCVLLAGARRPLRRHSLPLARFGACETLGDVGWQGHRLCPVRRLPAPVIRIQARLSWRAFALSGYLHVAPPRDRDSVRGGNAGGRLVIGASVTRASQASPRHVHGAVRTLRVICGQPPRPLHVRRTAAGFDHLPDSAVAFGRNWSEMW